MQIFVISLKDSKDRQKNIIAQCEEIGISPIFIDAIYGKDLTDSEVSQYCNQNKAKQLFGRELLLGEIGCALSHKKIYQKIVNENIPYAVILEDDAVIIKDFQESVILILEQNVNWDIVLLGHYRGFNNNKECNSIDSFWLRFKLNNIYRLGSIIKGGLGTHGYIISTNGARKLLNHLKVEKITHPIDKITSDSRIINFYGLFPSVVAVDRRFDSMIENENLRDNDRQGEVVYQIAKLIKKTPFFNITQSLWFIVLKVKPIKKYK